MNVIGKLREGKISVIDQENVTLSNVPRVEVSRDDLTDQGQIALDRALLEAERRWCRNKTEELTGASIVLSDLDLLRTLLDPRTVSCCHLTVAQRRRASELFIKTYVNLL